MPSVARGLANFSRWSTSRNSARSGALVCSVTRAAYAASISLPGFPCQSNPEIAALVSRTSRTTGFGAIGGDLGLDLLGRHGRKPISSQSRAHIRELPGPLGE